MQPNKKLTISVWGRGICQHRSGHLVYTSPKERRGKLVHRVVVDNLLKETPYSILLLLPWPYEVHHQDYNKIHNCPSNLLMLSPCMHSSITADRSRNGKGRFAPKWAKPPEWLPLLDGVDEDEVPF